MAGLNQKLGDKSPQKLTPFGSTSRYAIYIFNGWNLKILQGCVSGILEILKPDPDPTGTHQNQFKQMLIFVT